MRGGTAAALAAMTLCCFFFEAGAVGATTEAVGGLWGAITSPFTSPKPVDAA